jgi:hypothetical protein
MVTVSLKWKFFFTLFIQFYIQKKIHAKDSATDKLIKTNSVSSWYTIIMDVRFFIKSEL